MRLKIITRKEYEKLRQENKELKLEFLKKKADISILQSQINPHFLYNSLESIRGLALINEIPEIADISEALANFFRYSIDAKKNIISIQEEISSVENYMAIQQYRFEDRFTLIVDHDIDKELLTNIMMPKLIFQPLVENAINHAFDDMRTGCEVLVKIRKIDNLLKINIIDNGKGMDVTRLSLLNKSLNNRAIPSQDDKNNKSLGIALSNVKERVELFFGEESSFSIRSMVDIGTDVEIFLPILHKKDIKCHF